MALLHELSIPRFGADPLRIGVESGSSIILVGANGAGKTRLGVYIENQLNPSHRVATHKSLVLSDTITLMSLERAERHLRFGTPDGQHVNKQGSRWGGKPAVHLLNDFDALLQRLFADHARVASTYLQEVKTRAGIPIPTTRVERLKEVWERLLPHRGLLIKEATVEVYPISGANIGARYSASEMSDGERAIFYFLGQCLVAPQDGVIIIDEPEGHVHRALIGPLWDAIEKTRNDCGFIYITHDLDFAATRPTSAKFFIRGFDHPGTWDVQPVPSDTGLPESVVIELVGSRKPILFVEGERGSLDVTIYRHRYAQFTIVPIGSCDAVIHSVATYKHSAALHWLQARGFVDADDRTADEVASMKANGVHALPVAEVENLLLLPSVFLALAEALSCASPQERLENLQSAVMKVAQENVELVSSRFAIRQLDRHLKRVGLQATDLATLEQSYQRELGAIDPMKLFADFRLQLETSIQANDLTAVLAVYDNKGMLALAANYLGVKGPKELMEKVSRLLGVDGGKKLRDELDKILPTIA